MLGETMENNHQQPWTSSEPSADETIGDGPALPRVRGDGWVKMTWYSGKFSILNIRELLYLGEPVINILYPPSPSGNPVYRRHLSYKTAEPLSDEQARALLAQRGLPAPTETAEVGQEEESYDG
jgi:hypothetical protein